MTTHQDDFEILERRYAMYVLLAIDENPSSTKTDIMRLDQGNEKTKFQRINELISDGFVEQVQAEGYSTKRLALTDKGKAVLGHIRSIRQIIIERIDE